MFGIFSRRLYLRIWLAVVGSVAVLTLSVGWAWRVAAEQEARERQPPPPRPVIVRNAEGEMVSHGTATRTPGEGLEFTVDLSDGETLTLQIPPHPPRPSRDTAFWLRAPFGFVWMLGLVGLAVAVGVYPIVRRLTSRLEAVQRSVQRFGEGDLSARAPVAGHDEVADLAQRFNAAAARVETLVESNKSLLANASHELRSPLTRIRMGLELMGGQTSPSLRDEILRNIAELDQLVDEILLASRLDAQEADIGTMEAVDLTGLAAEECARADAELDAGTTLQGVEVRGVAKLLRRAVRNLLENARRYSHGGITLSVRRVDGQALLRVCDLGPGVPENLRERIFEPFYRLPGASEREGGVGLGLALVRSIVARHGGTVRCESRPDGAQGACFVLELPLREEGGEKLSK
ncbi:ATP-binding protein [Ramlibacter sp. H39-3-26]|uniref:HAMP domain-containing sensor histidine kinase n=1 Tax=Curvibacter soli TaxID=3031331 RepID=UPI0023D98174|nr:ATP-binding protein [Ramlibacter sp. H39-3-26]MDF1486082.1 ATP-binding protein [Ramlibacter sp. H39-3-26]